MSIGIPVKVLHEAEGHIITVETCTGEVYRGKLIEAEDNMNSMMQDVSVTYRDGQTAQLQNIYVRGSQVCFMVLPDMLKNAPMLRQQRSSTGGRDRILKTQVGRGGGRGRPRGGGRGGGGDRGGRGGYGDRRGGDRGGGGGSYGGGYRR